MIEIRHSQGSYPVHFMSLTESFADLRNEPTEPEMVVITDENVLRHWGHAIPEYAKTIAVPAGESSKSLATYGSLLEQMAGLPVTRGATVVALGGGVVGDLAGFVAATYMRGVRLAQIPTTLLSQVDSSVGGKVGIDLDHGKNLAGAFYPPVSVHVPLEALATLPERQFRNGLAEVWKYGLILDIDLLTALEKEPLRPNSGNLKAIVQRCIELKARCVEQDEYDTTGQRAKLNFGHTVGHAIEQVTGYETYLHGEAISIGMVVEARLGELLGLTAPGATEEVARLLATSGLPTEPSQPIDKDRLVAAMHRDKKVEGPGLAFSFLTILGECKLVTGVPESEVRAALEGI